VTKAEPDNPPEDLPAGRAWIVKPGTSVLVVCCDCELVHRVRFTLKGKNVVMRWYRDDKETKIERRRKEATKRA